MYVCFCFVLYSRDRQPTRMATWPMSGRRRRAAGHHRTHWHGGSLCGSYSQFGYQRLLPARTAQSAPFRWPAGTVYAPGTPRVPEGTHGYRSRDARTCTLGPRPSGQTTGYGCRNAHPTLSVGWKLPRAPPLAAVRATRRDRDPPTRTLTGHTGGTQKGPPCPCPSQSTVRA